MAVTCCFHLFINLFVSRHEVHSSSCNCNHLIDIEPIDHFVKLRVQIIKHVHNLHGSAAMTDSCKADDIAEENGNAIIGGWKNILQEQRKILNTMWLSH